MSFLSFYLCWNHKELPYKMILMTKKKQTHRHREQTSGYSGEREGEGGKVEVRD